MPPEDVTNAGATTLPAADRQDESGQTPPSGATKDEADQSGATSVSEPQREPVREKDWLGDAMRAVRASQYGQPTSKGAPPASDDGPEAKATEGKTPASVQSSAADGSPGTSPASKDTPPPDDNVIRLTPDELNRKVQSEVDRRLQKFQEEQALLRKKAEKAELRKKDPYAYVEQEEEEEERQAQLQQQMAEARTLAVNSLRAYDTAVLDPLFGLLPEREKQEILSKIEDGISGRGKAASQAFKVLEKQWKQAGVAEARKTLLNDQSFVKEVFAKYGNGGRIEPDPVPAAAASGQQSFNMNDWIRQAAANRGRG